MEEFVSFVGFSPWELIVCICNTLITFLIVKMLLFKPVRKMLAARQEEVQAMYSTAEKSQLEADALRQEYTQRLAKAKEEANEITKNATRRATVRSEEILRESTQKANDMLHKAEASIEQERKKAMNEIKDEISGLSVMIASKVVERDINEEDHKRMIEEFISKVG